MTTSEQALAAKLVKHPKFTWMPGMLASKGPVHSHAVRLLGGVPFTEKGRVPDLADAATVGCLLALCAEVHGRTLMAEAMAFRDEDDRCSHLDGSDESLGAALARNLSKSRDGFSKEEDK